ncbi:MAG: VPLPA-CTERM sorting domain-containing protein [Pseudomonadota bacterium]
MRAAIIAAAGALVALFAAPANAMFIDWTVDAELSDGREVTGAFTTGPGLTVSNIDLTDGLRDFDFLPVGEPRVPNQVVFAATPGLDSTVADLTGEEFLMFSFLGGDLLTPGVYAVDDSTAVVETAPPLVRVSHLLCADQTCEDGEVFTRSVGGRVEGAARSEVPLPLPAALLMSGLAGLAAFRRRA